jgi:hypothetical protein
MLRAVINDMKDLVKYAKMDDKEIEKIAYAQELELSRVTDTMIEKIIADGNVATSAPDKNNTRTEKIPNVPHVPSFVEWMMSTYVCDEEQARHWEKDKGYQGEYKNFVESLRLSRPIKRERVDTETSPRPVKREHVEKKLTVPVKRVENATRLTMDEIRQRADGLSFTVIVNGKRVEIKALNKSDAISQLNQLGYELQSATGGRTTRVIENAEEIRARGSSPSHTFDTLTKGGYIQLK